MTTENQTKKLTELYDNFRKSQMELTKFVKITLAEHDLSLHDMSKGAGLSMSDIYNWRKDYSPIFKLVEDELKKL